MGRKKKKPSARKRKALNAGIAVLVWIATAITEKILDHYLPIILGW